MPHPANPPATTEETITRVEDPIHVSEPMLTETPTLEVKDSRVRFSRSSFSHIMPQSMTITPNTQVNATPAALIEATNSAQRGSFVTKEDLDTYLKEIQAKSSTGVLDLKLPYH